MSVCGVLLRPLDEEPIRYEVTGFPDESRWRELVAAADMLKEITAA
jgi:hypothetical protein